jgi:glycosyltransferase involved in cell wall biosynthesis
MSLRVLFAIHGPASARTAVYRTVATKTEYLRRHGHDAEVMAAEHVRWTSHRLDPLCLPPALALKRLASYDVVVFHSYLGWAFHAARPLLDSAAHVVTVTSFHGLEPLYFHAVSDEAARTGHRLSSRYRILQGVVMPRLLRATCRASDAVFCLNSAEAAFVVDRGWAATDRVHVLPNGVEDESFVARAPRSQRRELLFIGQWLPAKGTAYLVEAFADVARSADVRLTCIGTGASADVVTAAFPGDVRARVHVVPSLDRDGVYQALRAADVFVFPTLSEGFSKALLEAMAAGLPIVATGVGAAVDVLQHGQNALLVPPASAPAVTAAVRRYLEDEGLSRRLGDAARAAAERYRLDHVCQQWLNRIVEVVHRKAGRPVAVGSERHDALR